MKACSVCGTSKDDKAFWKSRICRKCRIEQAKATGICYNCHARPAVRLRKCEKCCAISKANAANQYRKNRDAVVDYYGAKCACCGKDDRRILTLDHKNGDGAQHRRQNGLGCPSSAYRWVVKAGFPDSFQLLCWNCNSGKKCGNCCPHHPSFVITPETYNTRYERKIREAALRHYSPDLTCSDCGEDNTHFLTIDHKSGGGTQHRKAMGCSIFKWLKRNNYPDGFRVLCFNCNFLATK